MKYINCIIYIRYIIIICLDKVCDSLTNAFTSPINYINKYFKILFYFFILNTYINKSYLRERELHRCRFLVLTLN